MKILMLSCNTGQGHNSAAKAVCEQFIKLGEECVVKDTLAYASEYYSKLICESYTKIVMHTPRAFGAGYKLCKSMPTVSKIKSVPYISNMLTTKKLYDDIIEGGFEAVVCTHVFAGQAMTHIKHKYGLDMPVYIISTDYSFCPFFDELDVDRYFIPINVIRHEFTNKGIPKEKITVTGIPVSQRFTQNCGDKNAYKEVLSLDRGRDYCLIMSGSMGYGDIYELTDKILESGIENTSVIVICGNNRKLKDGLEEKYAGNGSVISVGYTNRVDEYMKASSVVVTKPGGLSSTESMVCGVPLVLTKPIPGCETENFELLTKLGTAVGGTKPSEAAQKIKVILTNPDVAEEIVSMQNKYISKTSAADIAEAVLKGKIAQDEFVS